MRYRDRAVRYLDRIVLHGCTGGDGVWQARSCDPHRCSSGAGRPRSHGNARPSRGRGCARMCGVSSLMHGNPRCSGTTLLRRARAQLSGSTLRIAQRSTCTPSPLFDVDLDKTPPLPLLTSLSPAGRTDRRAINRIQAIVDTALPKGPRQPPGQLFNTSGLPRTAVILGILARATLLRPSDGYPRHELAESSRVPVTPPDRNVPQGVAEASPSRGPC